MVSLLKLEGYFIPIVGIMIGSTKTWRMLENYFQHGVFVLTRVSDQIRFHLNMLWVNLFFLFHDHLNPPIL